MRISAVSALFFLQHVDSQDWTAKHDCFNHLSFTACAAASPDAKVSWTAGKQLSATSRQRLRAVQLRRIAPVLVITPPVRAPSHPSPPMQPYSPCQGSGFLVTQRAPAVLHWHKVSVIPRNERPGVGWVRAVELGEPRHCGWLGSSAG